MVRIVLSLVVASTLGSTCEAQIVDKQKLLEIYDETIDAKPM